MLNNTQVNAGLIGFLIVPLVLSRLCRPEPFDYYDLILALVIILILFGHRLPSLMRHLGNGPPGGFC